MIMEWRIFTMGVEENADIVMEGNRVVAKYRDEKIGHITVSEIDFQWCENTLVTMGGIGSVGTDERFRRCGIAGRMMKTAVAYSNLRGYVCGGVSTRIDNVARRLYSRAGYEHVFFIQSFAREPRKLRHSASPGTYIRCYRENDEHLITQLRLREYGGFFGTRRPDASRWLAMRQSALKDDPESILFAIQDEEIVGYASYFKHWFGMSCDICVTECGDRLGAGRALLHSIESRLAARECKLAVLSVTEDETFIREFLRTEGYRLDRERVFKVNILNLDGLLRNLAEALADRIRSSDMPDWTGTLRIEAESSYGVVGIGANPECYQLVLSASRQILTQVLCGRISGWEAYLRGHLNVTSRFDEDVPILLRALLPKVPCCHPIDEWW